MKKISLLIILFPGLATAETRKDVKFRQYSWEISGTLSGGQSTSFAVYDESNSGVSAPNSSYYIAYKWYVDFSPTLSFYVFDKIFVYASPALNISNVSTTYSALFPGNPGSGPTAPTTYTSEIRWQFFPFLGAGYVFQISDKLFLSTSIDVQRTEYSLTTRLSNTAPADYAYANPSLTRFNFRITPKIMIDQNLFLNLSLIMYYETDRIMVSLFNQKGFGARLDAVSATYNIGLSYLFN